MQKAPPTPKGFRDMSPALAKKRHEVINKIIEVLGKHDFVPIETPAIEFAETLKGKYGQEERLIYEFTDRGGRQLALRYDLTVPLARYVASHLHELKMPFRRYQIGQVFRGENPQVGRYREFTQLDFDTVGSEDLEEDATIVATAIESVKNLGLKGAQMLVNDRKNFEDMPIQVIRAIDKLHKIGEEQVKKELISQNMAYDDIENHLYKIKNSKKTVGLEKIFEILIKTYNLRQDQDFAFDPTLARGLDYYTGSIFELKPNPDSGSLSIGSGGRYDNLVGMFSKRQLPAVGFSFGIDRLIEALK